MIKDKDIISSTINAKEVANFSRIADEWWDAKGKFRVLHKFNPVRLQYILQQIYHNFSRDACSDSPLEGLDILDIGCGGGLLCEPLARLGANVTAIDVSVKNIEVAKSHAKKSGLDINYQAISLEDLLKTNKKFDVVLNMEVVEHVENVPYFLACCCDIVAPNGLLFIATLNRTLKAWLCAIIAAEYILSWLPRSTHSFDKFLKPSELQAYLSKQNFSVIAKTGIIYNILYDKWQLKPEDLDINYILVAKFVDDIAL